MSIKVRTPIYRLGFSQVSHPLTQAELDNNFAELDINASAAISAETSQRIAAVSTEASVRINAVVSVSNAASSAVSAETTARSVAVVSVSTALSIEVSTARAAEASLSSAVVSVSTGVSSEKSSRISADASISSALSTETSARTVTVGSVSSTVSTEIASRISAVASVSTKISAETTTRSTAVSSEASTARSAEASLSTAINGMILSYTNPLEYITIPSKYWAAELDSSEDNFTAPFTENMYCYPAYLPRVPLSMQILNPWQPASSAGFPAWDRGWTGDGNGGSWLGHKADAWDTMTLTAGAWVPNRNTNIENSMVTVFVPTALGNRKVRVRLYVSFESHTDDEYLTGIWWRKKTGYGTANNYGSGGVYATPYALCTRNDVPASGGVNTTLAVYSAIPTHADKLHCNVAANNGTATTWSDSTDWYTASAGELLQLAVGAGVAGGNNGDWIECTGVTLYAEVSEDAGTTFTQVFAGRII